MRRECPIHSTQDERESPTRLPACHPTKPLRPTPTRTRVGMEQLKLLHLLPDEARVGFFVEVTELLRACTPPAAAAESLSGYGLDFAAGEPAALLHAAKLLVCRVASRGYEADGAAAATLRADLVAAGLSEAAADWLRTAAESATLPCAAELRVAQAHAAANLANDYLHDFDWGLNYVLGSSALADVHAPLVQLQLQIAKVRVGWPLRAEALRGSRGGSGGLASWLARGAAPPSALPRACVRTCLSANNAHSLATHSLHSCRRDPLRRWSRSNLNSRRKSLTPPPRPSRRRETRCGGCLSREETSERRPRATMLRSR